MKDEDFIFFFHTALRTRRRKCPSAFRLHPLADQRGFPEAGGGREEGQFAAGRDALVQPLDKARAEDNSGPARGEVELLAKIGVDIKPL